MNAQARAELRNEIARKRLGVAEPPRALERDPGVLRANAWAGEVLDRYEPGRVGKCVYCGGPSTKRKWPRTCHGHEDLPKYDPTFQAELALRGIA